LERGKRRGFRGIVIGGYRGKEKRGKRRGKRREERNQFVTLITNFTTSDSIAVTI